MPNLTTEQQKDLEIYKKTGELGTLNSLLIEHCLAELKCSDHARDRFNSILRLEIPKNTDDLLISNGEYQIIFIQTILSKGVISFLNKRIEALFEQCDEGLMTYFESLDCKEKEGELGYYRALTPQTLDHLLHREFSEIVRNGKGLDKALKTINKLYLDSLRNTK